MPRYYFYPRSPCGERLSKNAAIGKPTLISIHALLAESDPETVPCGPHADISIHALLAESDAQQRKHAFERLVFLSTLSLRRATLLILPSKFTAWAFLSTLSLRRATHTAVSTTFPASYFYPRSPCGERQTWWQAKLPVPHFYPRSPCGERPNCQHRSHQE